LDLIEDDTVGARPKGLRPFARLTEDIAVIQAVETPVAEGLGVTEKRALADLPGPCQDDDRVIADGRLENGRDPAGIILFELFA
jgi:hypothetical protein